MMAKSVSTMYHGMVCLIEATYTLPHLIWLLHNVFVTVVAANSFPHFADTTEKQLGPSYFSTLCLTSSMHVIMTKKHYV